MNKYDVYDACYAIVAFVVAGGAILKLDNGEVSAYEKITNKEYEEWQKYKAEKAKGLVLLPDTLRLICEAIGCDSEKIGRYFLEILPKICPLEQI